MGDFDVALMAEMAHLVLQPRRSEQPSGPRRGGWRFRVREFPFRVFPSSGRCCVPGCDPIAASRKKNCRSTWGSFSSCITSVSGARAYSDLSWNC